MAFEVLEVWSSLSDELEKWSLCIEVFVIFLKMILKISDPLRDEIDLILRRSCVVVVSLIPLLCISRCFFCFCDHTVDIKRIKMRLFADETYRAESTLCQRYLLCGRLLCIPFTFSKNRTYIYPLGEGRSIHWTMKAHYTQCILLSISW